MAPAASACETNVQRKSYGRRGRTPELDRTVRAVRAAVALADLHLPHERNESTIDELLARDDRVVLVAVEEVVEALDDSVEPPVAGGG